MTDTEPQIMVCATKYANSWPKPANGVAVVLAPLSAALTEAHPTDAHFAPYATTECRRLDNDAIGHVPITLVYLVGDVDDPVAHVAKTPARPEWREVERAKIARLRAKHPSCVVYETGGGYRIIFRCEPFAITTFKDKLAWWNVYGRFVRYLLATFEIVADPACKNVGRLYRLPRVRRAGRDVSSPLLGDPERIEVLSLAQLPEAPREVQSVRAPKVAKAPRAAALVEGEDGRVTLRVEHPSVRLELDRALDAVRTAADGDRNEVLNREAYRLGGYVPGGHIDEAQLYDALIAANLANPSERKDLQKDARTIAGGIASGKRKPRDPGASGVTADRTDMRNAERLVEWFGPDLRYCASWGKWLAWDGARWRLDEQCRAHALAKATARRLLADALAAQAAATEALAKATADDDDDAKTAAKKRLVTANTMVSHAIASQNAARIEAMLAVAKSDPAVLVHHEALDADPFAFNVSNGTIDLRTGELRSHRREDFLTRLAPVAYDAAAKAPTWERFIAQAMAGNAVLVSFLGRLVGYAMTGDVREHVLAFFHGTGANGKSSFLGTVHAMMGDYATPAPRGLLFRSRGQRHPTELASLHGRRFVTCSEIEEGLSFDEALVKDLTGGDPISARRMQEDFWAFAPTHKLFIAGNHKPQVRGDDEGIWRRMRLVPWTVVIPEAQQDKALPASLRAELPGILAWAVRGCIAWQAEGLAAPEDVRAATAAYRTESDVLGQFFAGRVVFDPAAKVPRAELRQYYEAYCKENGLEPLGAKRFTGRLREHGVAETTMRVTRFGAAGSCVVDAWRGVRFATAEEQERRLAAAEGAPCRDVGTCSGQIQVSSTREIPFLRTNPESVPTSPYVPTGADEVEGDDDAGERAAIEWEAAR